MCGCDDVGVGVVEGDRLGVWVQGWCGCGWVRV